VAVGEQPEQHALEHVALADDGALDLGEDPLAGVVDLGERGHYNASSSSRTAASLSSASPGA
jgi:hypothetical protein